LQDYTIEWEEKAFLMECLDCYQFFEVQQKLDG
jgi:hypothetical protein